MLKRNWGVNDGGKSACFTNDRKALTPRRDECSRLIIGRPIHWADSWYLDAIEHERTFVCV